MRLLGVASAIASPGLRCSLPLLEASAKSATCTSKKLAFKFVAADMPFANKLTIHILAAVAEHEREAIRAAPRPRLLPQKRGAPSSEAQSKRKRSGAALPPTRRMPIASRPMCCPSSSR
jgi:hypothetical protein